MTDLPFRVKVDYSDLEKKWTQWSTEDQDDPLAKYGAQLREFGIRGHTWHKAEDSQDVVKHTDYHEDEPKDLDEELHDDVEDIHRAHQVLDLIR